MTAWDDGVPAEVGFWNEWFSNCGGEWHEDYLYRLDPETPLQPELAELLTDVTSRPIRILDVGAGPLTCLGKKWQGEYLEIHATDALAKHYDELLAKHGIAPPVRTVVCETERLDQCFEKNYFDLVTAFNCLDHSWDPWACVHRMVDAVKPGCWIYTRHHINEATSAGWWGLHQWNMWIEGNHWMYGNKQQQFDLTAAFASRCHIECALVPTGEVLDAVVKLRKHRGGA